MRSLFALSLLALVATAAVAAACATIEAAPILDDDATDAQAADSASDARSDAASDATPDAAGDAAADATPDATRDAAADADGPGEAGALCSFNRECQRALRCECDLVNGCACAPGPRGTGQSAVDTCDSGNQCASAVCVEGPADAGYYYCTGECASPADCVAPLPLCANIAFVGQICVRAPPK